MNPSQDDHRDDVEHDDGEPTERRAHPRLRCKGSAALHLYPAGIRCEGVVVDLSLGGCCIEVDEHVEEPTGTHVEVFLRVMGTTVQVAGILCNVRHQVWAGVQFCSVSSRKMAQIKELMDELTAGVEVMGAIQFFE